MIDLLPSAWELRAFLPEELLVAAVAGVVLVAMAWGGAGGAGGAGGVGGVGGAGKRNILAVPIAATVGLAAAWLSLFLTWPRAIWSPGDYFGGMLTLDPFAWTMKLLLIGFTLVVMALWFTDSHDKFITRGQMDDTPEFFVLLLSATLGLCVMVETTHLLVMFVGLEIASLPSYMLAGFRKGDRAAARASMKFVLAGAVATGLMLYGMSLLYGLFGTLDLRVMGAMMLEHGWRQMLSGSGGWVFALGLAGLAAGLGCKMMMVPLHAWCPDVFAAAGMDVTTFLAVGSVTGALAALLRVLLTLTAANGAAGVGWWLGAALLIVGAATCFSGNLGALSQTNVKRLLAWSCVAHAGYMLIGMSALVLPAQEVLGGTGERLVQSPAAETLLFYLLMFWFMNGGVFVAAAAIAQRLTGPTDAGMSLGVDKVITAAPPPPRPARSARQTGEELTQYAGLSRRAPILAAIMLVFLLSLAGIPLTIGFGVKIKLFSVLFDVGGGLGWAAIVVIGINSVLGAWGYFRVVRQMYLAESELPRLIEIAPVTVVALVLIVPNIVLFAGYGLVEEQARRQAEMLVAAARSVTPPDMVQAALRR